MAQTLPGHPHTDWTKLARWSVKILIALLILVTGIIGLFVAINWNDEKLSPDAEAMMREPQSTVADEENAYYVLRMINAPEGIDVFKAGQDSVKAERALYMQDEKNYINRPYQRDTSKDVVFRWDIRRCYHTAENCVQKDLQQRAELEEQMQNNLLLAQRYALMRDKGNYEEHLLPAITASLPAYGDLHRAADMLLTQASFDIADGKFTDGLQKFESNDRFVRMMLKNGVSLYSKMVAQAILRKQARHVSELILLYPQFLQQESPRLTALVRPMSEAEKTLSSAFGYEARVGLTILRNLRPGEGIKNEALMKVSWLKNVFTNYVYHENATSNWGAEYWRIVLNAENQGSPNLIQAREQLAARQEKIAYNDMYSIVRNAYNPLGKILLNAGMPDMLNYIERVNDNDAYLRLVGLQLDILHKHLAEDDIPAYLRSTPQALRNPYDGTPMSRDAVNHQLKFIGLQMSNDNPEGGKTCTVSVGMVKV